MGASPEKNGTESGSEMNWCLRALVRTLADGCPDADAENKFKCSVVHKRTIDEDNGTFIGGAVCTAGGGCVVSFGFEGAPEPDAAASRVRLSSERFGHTAVCDEPPAVQTILVIGD